MAPPHCRPEDGERATDGRPGQKIRLEDRADLDGLGSAGAGGDDLHLAADQFLDAADVGNGVGRQLAQLGWLRWLMAVGSCQPGISS